MIRFNANLYRIATMCMSKEETRYYLCGVFIEPHPQGGVTLTTTDGHRLLIVRDENGFADEKAIIKLGDALKACKAKRNMVRVVTINTGSDTATISEGVDDTDTAPVATAYGVRITGTEYPDYRRIVPQAPDMGELAAPAFNGVYLADFGNIGRELATHFNVGRVGAMRVLSSNNDGPALIVWPAINAAFGVLMPMRGDDVCDAPTWFRNPTPAPSIAPETVDQNETESA